MDTMGILTSFISIASPQPGRYSRSGTADHNSTDNLCAMWGSSFFITGESDTLRHRHPGTLLQDQQASRMQQVRDANCIFPFISNNKHLHIQVVRGGWIIRDAKMMIIKEIEIERLYKTNSTAMCLTPFKYVINTYTGYSSERPHYAFLRGHNCSWGKKATIFANITFQLLTSQAIPGHILKRQNINGSPLETFTGALKGGIIHYFFPFFLSFWSHLHLVTSFNIWSHSS